MAWSRERMDKVTRGVMKVAKWAEGQCKTGSSTSDLTEAAALSDTQNVSTATYTEDQNIRSVEVQSNTADGKLEIALTLADGSVLTFRTFTGGAWNYEVAANQAPIVGVTVTNVTGSALTTAVIINVSSRF